MDTDHLLMEFTFDLPMRDNSTRSRELIKYHNATAIGPSRRAGMQGVEKDRDVAFSSAGEKSSSRFKPHSRYGTKVGSTESGECSGRL